jgi:hypothetical protein
LAPIERPTSLLALDAPGTSSEGTRDLQNQVDIRGASGRPRRTPQAIIESQAYWILTGSFELLEALLEALVDHKSEAKVPSRHLVRAPTIEDDTGRSGVVIDVGFFHEENTRAPKSGAAPAAPGTVPDAGGACVVPTGADARTGSHRADMHEP